MHSSNDAQEFLHPFWLGLLILFNVIIIVALLCCFRRKYGSRLSRWCRNNDGTNVPPVLPSSSSQRATVYIPPRSPSPKLYTLIKTMKTAASQKDHQRAEVARKFYASMRHVSEENETIDVTSSTGKKQDENLRLFRTPRFFQSIAETGKSTRRNLDQTSFLLLLLRWINDEYVKKAKSIFDEKTTKSPSNHLIFLRCLFSFHFALSLK